MKKRNAKTILVNLKVRILVDPDDSDEKQIMDLTKIQLLNKIQNNDFEFKINDDKKNPFNTHDAINLAVTEVKNSFSPTGAYSIEGIINNRVKELLGDDYNEEDFFRIWNLDLIR